MPSTKRLPPGIELKQSHQRKGQERGKDRTWGGKKRENASILYYYFFICFIKVVAWLSVLLAKKNAFKAKFLQLVMARSLVLVLRALGGEVSPKQA